MRSKFFVAIVIITLFGCAASGTVFSPAIADKGKTVLYIYRPNKVGNGARSAWVYIDGNRRHAIENGGYQVYQLEPGEHSIKVQDHQINVLLKSMEPKYVRFRHSWALFNAVDFDPGQLKEMTDIDLVKTEIAKTKLSMR